MRFFSESKDGGPESTVTGYWLIEWKRLFSIALLRFDHGTREAYHSHAFNCVSWLLKGWLIEQFLDGSDAVIHRPGRKPIVTKRDTFHRVYSNGTSWVLTFRGPWSKMWSEYSPSTKKFSILADGRAIINGEIE